MADKTTRYAIPYPQMGDPGDVPGFMKQLAERVDSAIKEESLDLESRLRVRIGGDGGLGSMRAYVDTRDESYNNTINALVGYTPFGGLNSLKAYVDNKDTRLDGLVTDVGALIGPRGGYPTMRDFVDSQVKDALALVAANRGSRVLNGVFTGTGTFAAGENKQVFTTITIPTATFDRILFVTSGVVWGQGRGDTRILWNEIEKQLIPTQNTDETATLSWASVIAGGPGNVNNTLKIRATGITGGNVLDESSYLVAMVLPAPV